MQFIVCVVMLDDSAMHNVYDIYLSWSLKVLSWSAVEVEFVIVVVVLVCTGVVGSGAI